jgi:Dna[CI] antecedent, DciA
MGLFGEYESAKGIGDLLSGVKKEFNLDEIVAKERIKENADRFFGVEAITDNGESGNKIEILKLSAGLLTIICGSSAWREELKLRHDRIVAEINDYFNEKIVQRIEIR